MVLPVGMRMLALQAKPFLFGTRQLSLTYSEDSGI